MFIGNTTYMSIGNTTYMSIGNTTYMFISVILDNHYLLQLYLDILFVKEIRVH